MSSPMSPLAAQLFALGVDAMRQTRVEDIADWCGWQEDGVGGRFALWTLRKAVGPHPAGSTVSAATLYECLFPKATP